MGDGSGRVEGANSTNCFSVFFCSKSCGWEAAGGRGGSQATRVGLATACTTVAVSVADRMDPKTNKMVLLLLLIRLYAGPEVKVAVVVGVSRTGHG